MKESTKEWLESAKTDLRCCENNLHDEFVTNIVAFHSQQAVEKAFKAVLEEHDITIPKIHNLNRLFSMVEQFLKISVEPSKLDLLDEVYTSSRYPLGAGMMENGKPSLDECNELYKIAVKIFSIIEKILNNNYNGKL